MSASSFKTWSGLLGYSFVTPLSARRAKSDACSWLNVSDFLSGFGPGSFVLDIMNATNKTVDAVAAPTPITANVRFIGEVSVHGTTCTVTWDGSSRVRYTRCVALR